MNFQYTEDHIAIRDAAREFAENEIAPSAVERDKTGEFPTEIVQKLGELGFLGMMVPAEWGGAGLDAVSYVLAIEEIAKVDASVAVIMSVNNSLVCWVIETFGTDEQKERFLRPLATGKKLGAYCLSEPGVGSDATQQATTGTLQSDGSYLINGAKNWITNGTTADHYIIFAQTDATKGHRGITCFLIDKGMPGFETGLKEDKLGIRSSDTCSLGFTDVRVSQTALLVMLGTDSRSLWKRSMADASELPPRRSALPVAQWKERSAIPSSVHAFGKPINQLQAIQFKMADMQVKVEAARMLIFRAARKKDAGENFIKEAAMAKLYASTIAMEVATQAIQTHGGYGYVREYLVERALRDAKITEIYEGTSEIQHIVIARQLLKEYENN